MLTVIPVVSALGTRTHVAPRHDKGGREDDRSHSQQPWTNEYQLPALQLPTTDSTTTALEPTRERERESQLVSYTHTSATVGTMRRLTVPSVPHTHTVTGRCVLPCSPSLPRRVLLISHGLAANGHILQARHASPACFQTFYLSFITHHDADSHDRSLVSPNQRTTTTEQNTTPKLCSLRKKNTIWMVGSTDFLSPFQHNYFLW